MDHIRAGQHEVDNGPGGQHHLVRGLDPFAVGPFEADSPPVLLARHMHAQVRRLARPPIRQQGQAIGQQQAQRHGGKHHAPAQHHKIGGALAGRFSACQNGIDRGAEHHGPDDDGASGHDPEQLRDIGGVFAGRVQGALPGDAASQDNGRKDQGMSGRIEAQSDGDDSCSLP